VDEKVESLNEDIVPSRRDQCASLKQRLWTIGYLDGTVPIANGCSFAALGNWVLLYPNQDQSVPKQSLGNAYVIDSSSPFPSYQFHTCVILSDHLSAE